MSFLDSAAGPPEDEPEREDTPEEEGLEPATAGDRNPDHIQRLLRWSDPLKTINICDELIANGEEQKIAGLGMTVSRQYKIDDDSRSDWLDRTNAAMDLAMQVAKGKDWPWPNASNVVYPLVTTAAIQFSARAYPAIIPGPSIVKGIVIGDDKSTLR